LGQVGQTIAQNNAQKVAKKLRQIKVAQKVAFDSRTKETKEG